MYENEVPLLQSKSTSHVAARGCKRVPCHSALHARVRLTGSWQEPSLRGALRKLRVLPTTQVFVCEDRHHLLWQFFDCLAAELSKTSRCLRSRASLGFAQKQPWVADMSWCPRAFPRSGSLPVYIQLYEPLEWTEGLLEVSCKSDVDLLALLCDTKSYPLLPSALLLLQLSS